MGRALKSNTLILQANLQEYMGAPALHSSNHVMSKDVHRMNSLRDTRRIDPWMTSSVPSRPHVNNTQNSAVPTVSGQISDRVSLI